APRPREGAAGTRAGRGPSFLFPPIPPPRRRARTPPSLPGRVAHSPLPIAATKDRPPAPRRHPGQSAVLTRVRHWYKHTATASSDLLASPGRAPETRLG